MVVGTFSIKVPALCPNLIIFIGFISGSDNFFSVFSTSTLFNLLKSFDHITSKQ